MKIRGSALQSVADGRMPFLRGAYCRPTFSWRFSVERSTFCQAPAKEKKRGKCASMEKREGLIQ